MRSFVSFASLSLVFLPVRVHDVETCSGMACADGGRISRADGRRSNEPS
jgi:hypothetical protein